MKDYQKISDQELDQIFVDAFQQAEADIPAFETGYWDEMANLLPEKSKRKIAAFWWYASATLVLLLGASVWYFVPKQQVLPSTQIVKNTSTKSKSSLSTNDVTNSQQVNVAPSSIQKVSANQNKNQLPNQVTDLSDKKYSNPKSPVDNSVLVPNPSSSELTGTKEMDQTPSNESWDWSVNRLQAIPPMFQQHNGLAMSSVKPPMKNADPNRPSKWYANMSFGVGNSYQTAVSNRSTLVYGLGIGAGLHKQINTMELQFGVLFRSEFIDNLQWKQSQMYSDVSGNSFNRTELNQINQLYSLDFPLGIGGYLDDKNLLMAQVTPGIQLFGSGKQSVYQDGILKNQRNQTTKVEHTTTMTMEIGMVYYRKLNKDFQVGLAGNIDIIRPFNSTFYSGNQTSFPLNAQLSLRKFF